jgi:hypothetical protein
VHRELADAAPTLDGVSRFARDVSSRWKALALLSPGYHIRNMQDDMLRAYLAGARNPQSYYQAAKALLGKDGKVVIRKGPHAGTYTYDELVRLAEASGAFGSGWVRQEISPTTTGAIAKRVQGPGRGPVARASQKLGQIREDAMYLGTFLERLKAGDNAIEAARKTREYMIDYGEVGRAVQSARRFLTPFITYQTKAIPLMLRQAARRPSTMANFSKIANTLNEIAGSPDLSNLPPWNQSSFAVPVNNIVRAAIGAPPGQPILFNPESVLAFGSLNMLDPRISRLRMNIGGRMLSPFIRTPIELATRDNLFTGTEFAASRYAPTFVAEVAKRLGVSLPKKRDWYTGEERAAYPTPLDVVLRLWPQYSQAAAIAPGGTSSRLALARYLFGLSLSPYDQARAQEAARRFGGRD